MDQVSIFSARASNGAVAGAKTSLYVRLSSGVMWLSLLGMVAFGGYVIALLANSDSFYTDDGAYAVAAIFVAIALPVSLHDIHMHLTHYRSPLQRLYIRVLWMVPIYSVQSWLALRFHKERIYLVAARECYEAYVLYAFFGLCIGYLGGKRSLAARLRLRASAAIAGDSNSGKEYLPHLPPCSWCCRRGWRAGSRFVHRCAVGVYTYVLLRVLCTLAIIVAELAHAYKEEWSNPTYAVTSVIINVAQCAALYCLGLMYARLHNELEPMGPLGKFLVIKAVVFVSWWQGLAVSGAVNAGLVPPIEGRPPTEVATFLQDFAIAVEMSVAAIAHAYFFSFTDFNGDESSPVVRMQAAQQALDAKLTAARRAADAEAARTPRVAAAARAPELGDLHRGSGGGASADLFGAGVDDDEDTGADEWAAELELHDQPLGVRAAVFDMMPVDVLQESADNLRGGFGIVHKREKRAKARRQAIDSWAKQALDEVGTPAGADRPPSLTLPRPLSVSVPRPREPQLPAPLAQASAPTPEGVPPPPLPASSRRLQRQSSRARGASGDVAE
jgi:hypothetical protein